MKKIEEVKKDLERELMPLSNISGIYIGEKDNRKVIKVGIKNKDSDSIKLIDKNRDGYDIIVEETGEYSAY